jgi:hypothetical protein
MRESQSLPLQAPSRHSPPEVLTAEGILNQAQLLIQWDKKTGQLAIVPQNMTEAEVPAILRAAIQMCDKGVLEKAKNSSGLIVAPSMPKVKGD